MFDTKPQSSVLHITDSHIMAKQGATLLGINTAYYFNAVLHQALLSSRKFDLCLFTGDLAQEPYPASYEYLLKMLRLCHIPCLCLPGNHDDFAIMQAVLNTETVNCNKVKILGNWLIIALNSQIYGAEGGHLPGGELSFLEQSLQAHRNLHTVIAVHHHCLPTGSQWMDTMMIDNADELFGVVRRYPQVKAIINGHIHQVMGREVDGTQVLTTPSTCFQFMPESKNFSLDDQSPGYRWLDLFDDGTFRSNVERIPEKLIGLQKDTGGY